MSALHKTEDDKIKNDKEERSKQDAVHITVESLGT